MQHAPFTPRQQHFWHPRQLAENSAVLPEGADPCVYFGANATVDQYGCPCRAEGSSESAAETFLVIFGIGIHIIGSIGINTGQNLQAMGLAKLDQADRQKCGKLIRSRLWLIGCSLFISCSIVNFAALTLAPASILVPLEAVQFIVNVAFGKYVRKVEVPMRMLAGVLSMVVGVILAVAFGESSNFCFTEEELMSNWTFTKGWGWWIFLAITFGISMVALVAHNRLWARRAAGKYVKNADVLLPILYSIPSALLGGAQMIVQSKCLAELTELMARGEKLTIAGWFFWVEALLVSTFGLFWFFRLTQSLGMYEPLFIIPLMQVRACATHVLHMYTTCTTTFGARGGGGYRSRLALSPLSPLTFFAHFRRFSLARRLSPRSFFLLSFTRHLSPPPQANFIVWGGIAGGIFFHEFAHLHLGPAGAGSWVLYILGLVLVVYGLYLVRPKVEPDQEMTGAAELGTNYNIDMTAAKTLPPAKQMAALVATPPVRQTPVVPFIYPESEEVATLP